MHATIMTFDQPLTPHAPALTRLVDHLAVRPGFTDGHLLYGASSPRSRVIALWQNAENARLATTSPGERANAQLKSWRGASPDPQLSRPSDRTGQSRYRADPDRLRSSWRVESWRGGCGRL